MTGHPGVQLLTVSIILRKEVKSCKGYNHALQGKESAEPLMPRGSRGWAPLGGGSLLLSAPPAVGADARTGKPQARKGRQTQRLASHMLSLLGRRLEDFPQRGHWWSLSTLAVLPLPAVTKSY